MLKAIEEDDQMQNPFSINKVVYAPCYWKQPKRVTLSLACINGSKIWSSRSVAIAKGHFRVNLLLISLL